MSQGAVNDCTVRGKGNERVEEARRVVWVDQIVVVVMMWMEVMILNSIRVVHGSHSWAIFSSLFCPLET